jgi:gamma-glutamyltranspeptidase/glutathione hydrolase/leukotriene-C4 hydrolase
VLKENGTAVDAAIAATLCTGVVNMFSSGLGGGGFMIIRDPQPCTRKERKAGLHHCSDKKVIDFRETGPAGSSEEMYELDAMLARYGGLAVGVPAELRGLEEAYKRWGRLPWARLVEPAIKLAEGTYVSRELERRLRLFGSFMINDPDWSPIFINQDTGALLKYGDTIRRPGYAHLLRAVAAHGASAFYEGEYAASMVEKVQSKGGILTLEDLKRYRVRVSDAIQGDWLGRRVFTTPAPTSGHVLLSVLNILSGYKHFVTDGPEHGLSAHRFIEALKFGSAQRTRIGDPDFMNATSLMNIDKISTKEEADYNRARLDDNRTHKIDYYDPLYDIKDMHGTMHLSALDENGMAVSLTSTVNLIFGSHVMDPVSGVIFNDEMDDSSTPGKPNAFGLNPSPFNYPQPGKRPLSSTSPAIVEHSDGSVYLAIGGSGGSRIFGSVAQVLLNLDWGMDISEAIERPRIHHQLLPTYVSAETTTSPHIVEALQDRGHEVQFLDIDLAVAEVQAVLSERGPGRFRKIMAASDSRKEGVAVAY